MILSYFMINLFVILFYKCTVKKFPLHRIREALSHQFTLVICCFFGNTLFLFWTLLCWPCFLNWLNDCLSFIRRLGFHRFFWCSSSIFLLHAALPLVRFRILAGKRRFPWRTLTRLILSNLNSWWCLSRCSGFVQWSWRTVTLVWAWTCVTL